MGTKHLITWGCALLLAAATPAWGSPSRGSASLLGVVTTHDHGAALNHVSVTLRSETNHAFIQVRATGRDGAFQFDELPAGIYSIEATRAGFERATVEPILVLEGTVRTEHVTLQEADEPPQTS